MRDGEKESVGRIGKEREESGRKRKEVGSHPLGLME